MKEAESPISLITGAVQQARLSAGCGLGNKGGSGNAGAEETWPYSVGRSQVMHITGCMAS